MDEDLLRKLSSLKDKDKIINELKSREEEISRIRDSLSELIAHYEQLQDDCYEAQESISYAIDALSRMV